MKKVWLRGCQGTERAWVKEEDEGKKKKNWEGKK